MNIHAVNLKLQVLNAKKNPGQTLIDDVLDEYLKDAPELFEDLLKPLITYLEKKKDFSTALKDLFDLYSKMDFEMIEDILVQLNFMSEMSGDIIVREMETGPKDFNLPFNKDVNLLAELKLCFDKSPADAVEYLQSMGIDVSDGWEETLEKIKAHCFTVSKVSRADVLQMFHEELTAALEDGQGYKEWKNNISTLLAEKGYYTRDDGSPYRLDTIYRMNVQGAYQRGRYLQQKQVIKNFPYWEFVAVLDNRTTHDCLGLNSIILKSNDAFWASNYPPRHFLCRSVVRSVSDAALARRGLELNSGDDTVDIDGVLTKIKQVKPVNGFDNTPDAIWRPDLSNYNKELKTIVKKDKR